MKLYGDFDREDWLNAMKIKAEDVPDAFILHGEWEHEWNLASWKELLHHDQWLPDWNAIVGTYGDRRIGFANVFGGPIAASVAHRFSVLETETFIQTGYFGGLSHDVQYGDIFIATSAAMEDGVSHWYLPERKTVEADEALVREAIRFCEEKNYSYVTGPIFTTGAIHAETSELVASWADDGYIGVDMETATTFAVAKKYGRKAISLLNLSDHIIKGDTLYSDNLERDEIEAKTDDRIEELALHLSHF
ncbi:nucleoside phosphorylase [Alkalihalobacillus sp. CinArs1]|uniref:nucleoside phosphorylase n=1 Tax=Alkalihalobacillus sp. CinArs1 TaxID=2995314 RepID=UPI0022DDD610|nr:uridine phosphorylase [Alkalihalobacillus sp. CinArs1]